MKYVRIAIYIIYFIVYGYSAYKTGVEPDNKIWGYICALVFAILSIMFVNHYMNNSKNSDNKSENN
jgi:quinol-cytochrome oxidoreductase complex cytochrome b subunit